MATLEEYYMFSWMLFGEEQHTEKDGKNVEEVRFVCERRRRNHLYIHIYVCVCIKV